MHKFYLISLFAVLLAGLVSIAAAAKASGEGAVVRASNGAIFLVTQGERRGFPSSSIYFSNGYKFSDASAATAADLALPEGQPMDYRDGALVKDHGTTVYLISGGLKHPFSSAEAFLNLGYSFANVLLEPSTTLARVVPGSTIDSSIAAHLPGTLVNDGGAVYLVTATGLHGYATPEAFHADRYDFKDVVPANPADRTLLPERQPTPTPTPTPAANGNHAPSAPVISGVVGTFPQTYETFKFTSTDPDGNSLAYSIDWGDGTTPFTTTAVSGATISTTHLWVNLGTYQITASVSDGQGGTASSSIQLPVATDAGTFGPAVTVITPNGGETFAMNQPVQITWTRNWVPPSSGKQVDIYFSRGGINVAITTKIADSSYTWIPSPSDLTPADNYRIVVFSRGSAGTDNANLGDQSDGDFTISP